MVKEHLVNCCPCEAMVIVPSLLADNVTIAMGFLGSSKMGNICVEEELEKTLGPVFSLLGVPYSKSETTALDLNPTTGILKVRNLIHLFPQFTYAAQLIPSSSKSWLT